MQIDRMELVGLMVQDLDGAVETFTRAFGLQFREFTVNETLMFELLDTAQTDEVGLGPGARIAMDTSNVIELIQAPTREVPEGFRNIHFKVQDIDSAAQEMRDKGFQMVSSVRAGGMREVIFEATGLHGMRLCLTEYDAPSMIEAMLDQDELLRQA